MAHYSALKFAFEGQQLIVWTRYDVVMAITTAKRINGHGPYNCSNFNRADIPPEKHDALRQAVESTFGTDDAGFYEDADMGEILLQKAVSTPDE